MKPDGWNLIKSEQVMEPFTGPDVTISLDQARWNEIDEKFRKGRDAIVELKCPADGAIIQVNNVTWLLGVEYCACGKRVQIVAAAKQKAA